MILLKIWICLERCEQASHSSWRPCSGFGAQIIDAVEFKLKSNCDLCFSNSLFNLPKLQDICKTSQQIALVQKEELTGNCAASLSLMQLLNRQIFTPISQVNIVYNAFPLPERVKGIIISGINLLHELELLKKWGHLI